MFRAEGCGWIVQRNLQEICHLVHERSWGAPQAPEMELFGHHFPKGKERNYQKGKGP